MTDTRLVVYGSLAPGECNHHVIAHMAGEWRACTITGRIAMRGRYKVLTWDPDAPAIPALLFTSEALRAGWAALDAFEGADYERIEIPALVDGREVMANVYVALSAGTRGPDRRSGRSR